MKTYLGQFDVDLTNTPFANYTPIDWVETYISYYGGIDGSHHKNWVLDQCLRICKGTPVIVQEARWKTDSDEIMKEYRFQLGNPSREYTKLINSWKEDYDYDEGTAP